MLPSESYFVTLILVIIAATYITTAQTLQDSDILLDDSDIPLDDSDIPLDDSDIPLDDSDIPNVDKSYSFQNREQGDSDHDVVPPFTLAQAIARQPQIPSSLTPCPPFTTRFETQKRKHYYCEVETQLWRQFTRCYKYKPKKGDFDPNFRLVVWACCTEVVKEGGIGLHCVHAPSIHTPWKEDSKATDGVQNNINRVIEGSKNYLYHLFTSPTPPNIGGGSGGGSGGGRVPVSPLGAGVDSY